MEYAVQAVGDNKLSTSLTAPFADGSTGLRASHSSYVPEDAL